MPILIILLMNGPAIGLIGSKKKHAFCNDQILAVDYPSRLAALGCGLISVQPNRTPGPSGQG